PPRLRGQEPAHRARGTGERPRRGDRRPRRGRDRSRPAQAGAGGMRHLLSIEDVSREDIENILKRAKEFEEVSRRPIKKVPALQYKTVVNLFYEASTRTSTSFEMAAKRLSAE